MLSLKEENARLRVALGMAEVVMLAYADHKPGCGGGYVGPTGSACCTCGFSAAAQHFQQAKSDCDRSAKQCI